MAENYTNTASDAQLSASVTDSVTSWSVTGATGWPAHPFWARIATGTLAMEIVRVTNVTGSTWTVTRAQGGTSGSAHGAGDVIEHIFPAGVIATLEAHREATTNVHGLAVSSAVVGTTDAQTLTNKHVTGAHRAVFSDAVTPAHTATFEVAADSTAAKDGFVVRNTAATATRAAFLSEQSGTERFKVDMVGKVTVTPASGVGVENNGTLQQDGNATFAGTVGVTGATSLSSVSTSGNATVGGTLGVTGTSTLAAVNQGNTAVAGTLSVSGASTLASIAGTAASLSGTLGVTGATTLTTLAASSTVTAATGVRSLGSTLVDIPVVTVLPGSGTADQVVWLTTTRQLYRWSGSAWVAHLAYAQLRQTVVQSIPSGAYTPLTWNTEDWDSHDGHAVNGSRYTCVQAGVYEFSGTYTSAQFAGSHYTAGWAKNGSGVYTPQAGSVITLPSAGSAVHTTVPARTIQFTLAVGDWVEMLAWQNTGVARDTVATGEHMSSMTVRQVA